MAHGHQDQLQRVQLGDEGEYAGTTNVGRGEPRRRPLP
jgi:hypothetical protein